MKKLTGLFFATVLVLGGCSDTVYLKSPDNGDTVKNPFKVEMSVCGMDVRAAGEEIEGTGHHHLIIDGDCISAGSTIPKDATHKHFGKGQTETMLTLEPGDHTLTLQFANGLHASYGKEMCKTINIKVE
ncbi:MAG: DUF4399 domain-containing protein [Mariprofundaceae bacterium]